MSGVQVRWDLSKGQDAFQNGSLAGLDGGVVLGWANRGRNEEHPGCKGNHATQVGT